MCLEFSMVDLFSILLRTKYVKKSQFFPLQDTNLPDSLLQKISSIPKLQLQVDYFVHNNGVTRTVKDKNVLGNKLN